MTVMRQTTMRAVRIHDWGQAPVVQEIPVPVPGPGEALIQVEAAAIGHLDLTVAGGNFNVKPTLPYVGGVEGVGRVVEAPNWDADTRVLLRGGGLGLLRDGTWAEYVTVSEKALTPLPAGMSPQLGASFFVPLTTAAAAVHEIGQLGTWPLLPLPAEQECVLVTGAAGAVGSLAVQLAHQAGAQVYGLVIDEQQAARLPAEATPIVADDQELQRELAQERPGTLLIDTLGGQSLNHRLGWVQAGGRAVQIGYVIGEQVTLDLPNWLLQDVALLPTNMIRRKESASHAAAKLAPKLVSGELVLPVEEFAISDAVTALARLQAGEVVGRAVFVV